MIRILEDNVINRIAAGEVVERPAAVVKELVENSLDAGATEVQVSLRAGGTELIQVVDNGTGMRRQDAALCVERHATSKIRSFEDLELAGTLGFRGEALPSISSVSRFSLSTRRREDEVGTLVEMDGGRLLGVRDDGGPPGTRITVRTLFFNVPARRKFLRTVSTELAHCLEAVRRQVLMRPELDIEVRHDGRTLLRSPRTEAPRVRLVDILGNDAAELISVDFVEDELRCLGFIAPVGVHRNSALGASYHHVNGRFVRDPLLRRAIAEAYRGLVPKGRHPMVVLDVRIPRDAVDCNVHPAKTEVRFADARGVQRVVSEGLRRALEDRGVKQRNMPRPVDRPVDGVAQGPAQLTLSGEVVPPAPTPRVRALRPAPVPPPAMPPQAAPKESSDGPLPAARPPSPLPVASVVSSPAPTPWRPISSPAPAASWTPEAPEAAARRFRDLRVLGQIADRQIICADGADLVVVDQEAARQAAIVAVLQQGGAGDPLGGPVVVPVDRALRPVVALRAAMLKRLGLDVEEFGEDAVAVRAVPAALKSADIAALVTVALEATASAIRADLAAATRSIAGQTLSPYEMRALLRRLDDLGLRLDAAPPGVLARFSPDTLRAALGRGSA